MFRLLKKSPCEMRLNELCKTQIVGIVLLQILVYRLLLYAYCVFSLLSFLSSSSSSCCQHPITRRGEEEGKGKKEDFQSGGGGGVKNRRTNRGKGITNVVI